MLNLLASNLTARFNVSRADRLGTWVVALALLLVLPTVAEAKSRKLSMYYTHTKESLTVTYKKNGKYVPSALKKLNRLLRDFRRNEPTKMDPKLFDLVWEVYQKSGSRKPIHVISGYRSPRTNNMLRRRGRKVAKNSMHTRGKALDFFLPDVKVSKLRALGLKAHVGGVGYYKGSFVHLDTGRVRHWPRMSRKQLARVFPKGRTIHVPSNGKPLKGYKVAAANLKKGLNADGSRRNSRRGSSGGNKPTVLARLLNRDNAKKEAPTPKPAKRVTRRPAAAVAARQPKPAPSGPDPFALEVAADNKRAADTSEPVETAVLALPTVVAVPRARPRPQVPAALPAEKLNQQQLEPVGQTQLALATPQVPAQRTLRPSADLGLSSSNVETVAAASNEQDLADLRSRIRTALSRQRELTAAERAVEAQATSQLTPSIAALPIPGAAPKRAEEPSTQLAWAPASETTIPRPRSRLEGRLALPKSPVGQNNDASRLQDNAGLLRQNKEVPTPNLRASVPQQAEAEINEARPKEQPRLPLAKGGGMIAELQLGDLDGEDVKAWAIAESTRVGPFAALSAPNYRVSTRRAAPASVYSVGFANNQAPLRADRFTGRALTRVAFAHFSVTQ